MAELNVEPKKSSPIWWIILIIIVVLIILYFVFRNSNTNGNVNTVKDSTGMILINSNQKNTIAMYQWQQLNEPAQYS